ncbi:unnamed protein product [Danaus chrysippus]|uniref:(African queen) hypothetical protein n=1 Tax=Danaus chrysippus TaxID=151541 RepID=A0A8J2QM67_9NEOP|nr:unnamed protein product [Danaus chrysippus]
MTNNLVVRILAPVRSWSVDVTSGDDQLTVYDLTPRDSETQTQTQTHSETETEAAVGCGHCLGVRARLRQRDPRYIPLVETRPRRELDLHPTPPPAPHMPAICQNKLIHFQPQQTHKLNMTFDLIGGELDPSGGASVARVQETGDRRMEEGAPALLITGDFKSKVIRISSHRQASVISERPPPARSSKTYIIISVSLNSAAALHPARR